MQTSDELRELLRSENVAEDIREVRFETIDGLENTDEPLVGLHVQVHVMCIMCGSHR